MVERALELTAIFTDVDGEAEGGTQFNLAGTGMLLPPEDLAAAIMARRTAIDRFQRQEAALARQGTRWLWFYTPMMFGLAERLRAEKIVSDCTDELGGGATTSCRPNSPAGRSR